MADAENVRHPASQLVKHPAQLETKAAKIQNNRCYTVDMLQYKELE